MCICDLFRKHMYMGNLGLSLKDSVEFAWNFDPGELSGIDYRFLTAGQP